eukprot:scaffold118685_cov32-Prasinocladus_malaysianus.AAC.1
MRTTLLHKNGSFRRELRGRANASRHRISNHIGQYALRRPRIVKVDAMKKGNRCKSRLNNRHTELAPCWQHQQVVVIDIGLQSPLQTESSERGQDTSHYTI